MIPFDIALPIVQNLVHQALVAGYNVSVFDSEEWSTLYSYNEPEIMQDVSGVEEVLLAFHTHDRNLVGQIFLILDNGKDAIVDYSNTEAMHTLINKVQP